MPFRVLVKNSTGDKVAALTKDQLAHVEPYLISCLNTGKRPGDAEIVKLLDGFSSPLVWEPKDQQRP